MTESELDRTINHLWEMYQTTYFDYFFADENCSAVLADLLAVAYKDDDRVNLHGRWYYLPGEMVKHFHNLEGRINSIKYRPSLKKQVGKLWENLNAEEILQVKSILDNEELIKEENNLLVLDGVIAYLDFTHYRIKKPLSEKLSKIQRKSLIRRSTLAQGKNTIEVYDQNNMPENSHDPQKLTTFFRTENSHSLLGFEFKQGYHDLLSNDRGFDKFSQFDFLSFSMIYDLKKNMLTYDQLTVVNIASLHEYLYYDPQLSWRAKVTSERLYDLDCLLCHKVNVNAYGGITLKLGSKKNSVFNIFAGAFGEVSHHFEKGFRVGPGIEISFYSQLGEMYKIGIFNELRFDATKKITEDYYNQMGLRHSFFTDNKRDYRLESSVISNFRSFKKNTVIHQVTYGQYF
jgi:hypothetical protein